MKKALIAVSVILGISCSAFAQENPYSSQLEQITKNAQEIKILQSNQANLYLKFEDLLVKYGELKGKLDDLARKVENIQNNSGASPEIKSELEKLQAEVNALKQQISMQPIPANQTNSSQMSPEEAEFKKAKALYDNKEYNQAIKAFGNFQKTYKNSKLNDQVLYYIADSYYNLKIYDKAIINFDQIVNAYPKSKLASKAMLKEGLSFINLGDKIDGRFLLEKVIKLYPNSPEAKEAKLYLEKTK